jgi:hypothetical protein
MTDLPTLTPALLVPEAPSRPTMRQHRMQKRWDIRRCYGADP